MFLPVYHSEEFSEVWKYNEEFCKLLSHQKCVRYFENSKNLESNLELLKLSQLFFAVPSHDEKTERILSLMQCSGQKREAALIYGLSRYNTCAIQLPASYMQGIPWLPQEKSGIYNTNAVWKEICMAKARVGTSIKSS